LTGIFTIYNNAQQDRDRRYLDDDGAIVTEKEGTEPYRAMPDKFDAWLNPYPGLNVPDVKRILFPTTVFLKDGEVSDVYLVTVADQADGYAPLTDARYAELLAMLTEAIEALLYDRFS
jgi:hypothetical protein